MCVRTVAMRTEVRARRRRGTCSTSPASAARRRHRTCSPHQQRAAAPRRLPTGGAASWLTGRLDLAAACPGISATTTYWFVGLNILGTPPKTIMDAGRGWRGTTRQVAGTSPQGRGCSYGRELGGLLASVVHFI
jgi:hypothetical protein